MKEQRKGKKGDYARKKGKAFGSSCCRKSMVIIVPNLSLRFSWIDEESRSATGRVQQHGDVFHVLLARLICD